MDKESAAEYELVSFDSEQLILVDENDREIGTLNKGDCHVGEGTLHRAFSLFVFNDKGELLLQQRSDDKRLWPLFWSNTCCSHPRFGETMDVAVHRRLEQELGMAADLQYLYKFQYQAQYDETGAEHELCWVYIGRSKDDVRANPSEIAAWRWIAPEDLEAEVAANPENFTPWFKLEWQKLRTEFKDKVAALFN